MAKKFDVNKAIGTTMKFVNMKGVIALKEGMLSILPLTVAGSIFLVIAALPFKSVTNAIADVLGKDWAVPLFQVVEGTFAIMGLIACFAIAYAYAKNDDCEPLPAGVLSVAAFFITLRPSIEVNGEVVAGAMTRVWFGGQGIIAAIIIGLSVGAIYTFFVKRKITIKMPDQVPQAVANQFTAIIPAMFIFFLSMVTFIIFDKTTGGTFIEWIYSVIQVPLQGLTDSLPGVIGIAFFISFLWWFGVHGQSVVNGIVTSLLMANATANTGLLTKVGEVTVANGGRIVTQQFLDSFLLISGSGITFGLLIAMLFAAKSKQYKALGRVSAFPAIFNINEPITFGFPIVMNPLMFLPFILVPVLSAILVYGAIWSGFMQPFTGAILTWSTPVIISGLIVAGWQGAVVQILILGMSVVIYYPFFKKQDMITYEKEQLEEQNQAG